MQFYPREPPVMDSLTFGIFKPVMPTRLLYILFLTMLLLWSTGCRSREGFVLPFTKKVTDIRFPDHIKIVSEYDNGAYEAMGKYQLRPQDLPAFIGSHPFVPLPPGRPRLPLMDFNLFCQAHLIPLSDSLPSPDARPLHYFSGCKPDDTWVFILDEKTGELWINVQYPDPGGLAFECNL